MNDKPVAAGKSSFDLIDQEKVFSQLALEPGTSFLDLACGAGRYSLHAAELIGDSGRVYAFDLWAEGLDLLRQEAQRLELNNIETRRVDITGELPLTNSSIDCALFATALHDLPREGQLTALRELARVLNQRGLLHIIEFKKLDHGPGPGIQKRIDVQALRDMLSPYGFRPVSCFNVGEFNYLASFSLTS